MNFDEYQKQAASTAIYAPEMATLYLTANLPAEVGELLDPIAKSARDRGGKLTPDDYSQMFKEAGDVLWVLTMFCEDILGVSLADVAQANLDKLRDRKLRHKIGGDGDKR